MANIFSFSVKDKALVSWIEEKIQNNGNLSVYICHLVRNDMERNVSPNMEVLGNAIEDLSRREIETREQKEKYIEQMTKMVSTMRKKMSDEKAKAQELINKELKLKEALMKSMEKSIKDNGIEEVEKELIDAYNKDKKIADNKDKMTEFMKKFREKYKYFLYGASDIGCYCRYKSGDYA